MYTNFVALKGAYIPFVMLYDNNRFISENVIIISFEYIVLVKFCENIILNRKHYGGNLNRFHFKSDVMTTIIKGSPIHITHIHKEGVSDTSPADIEHI